MQVFSDIPTLFGPVTGNYKLTLKQPNMVNVVTIHLRLSLPDLIHNKQGYGITWQKISLKKIVV